MASASAIYEGWVSHHRFRPRTHGFRYRLGMLYLDLDELPEGVALRVGTTGSVLVMTGTGGAGGKEGIPAVPKALQ